MLTFFGYAQARYQLGVGGIDALGLCRIDTTDAQCECLRLALRMRAGLGQQVQLAFDYLIQLRRGYGSVQQSNARGSGSVEYFAGDEQPPRLAQADRRDDIR